MEDSPPHDELISQLCSLTGASPADARQYLVAANWDLSGAATEYYTSQEEGIQGAQAGGQDDPQVPEAYTGPRTLDGRPAPASIPTVAPTARSAPPPKRGGVATLDSLNQASSGAGHGHAHDDDDDSDDEDFENEQPRDLFTGGEKSGLAVQDPSNRQNNPSRLVNDIMKKARANAAAGGAPGGGESSSAASSSRFFGSGQTLGGDGAPSETIPDPNPRPPPIGEAQARSLHLWNDGFSVGDGPLFRFDDPANEGYLRKIRSGHAPTDLLDVAVNQPVNITLHHHDENYKPQPKVYKPFSGGGQRLGSPTPGPSAASSSTPAVAATTNVAPTAPVEEAQTGSLRVNIRIASGQVLRARFNPEDTIGDIYEFIARAPNDGDTRPWVLSTTMPNVNHTDKTLKLGDVDAFKRGGVAIQKWA